MPLQEPVMVGADRAIMRQDPTFLNCHHAGNTGLLATFRSMIALSPLTSERSTGGSNEIWRSLLPTFVSQAKVRLVAPPAPRQLFQARLNPPADAIEAVRARTAQLTSRSVLMSTSLGRRGLGQDVDTVLAPLLGSLCSGSEPGAHGHPRAVSGSRTMEVPLPRGVRSGWTGAFGAFGLVSALLLAAAPIQAQPGPQAPSGSAPTAAVLAPRPASSLLATDVANDAGRAIQLEWKGSPDDVENGKVVTGYHL